MSLRDTRARIEPLGREHLEPAIDVLTRAFLDYPLMRYVYAVSACDYGRSVRGLMRFACEVRFLLGHWLLGCLDGSGDLVGVAGLSRPGRPQWPDALEQVYAELCALVGPASTQRLEDASELADAGRPETLHHQLGIIGIDPQAQGSGYGGLMLREVAEMVDGDPSSTGCWLDTETQANVDWYLRHGFRVRARHEIGPVTVWGMWRERETLP